MCILRSLCIVTNYTFLICTQMLLQNHKYQENYQEYINFANATLKSILGSIPISIFVI